MAVIATAEVRVIADTSNFLRDLRQKLRGELGQYGKTAGRQFNQQFNRQATQGIRRALGRHLTGQTMSRYGQRAGRDYSRSFRKSLLAGLKRIKPDFDVDWNASAIALAAGAIGAAAGALAGIPAVTAIAAGGIATLVVALRGTGKAFSAAFDDADAFAEAIEDLAPAAKNVAREFRRLAPALTSLRVDTQQAAFAELEGVLESIGDNLGGPFRSGMTRAASAMGRIARAVGDFLSEASSADTATAAFEALESALDDLATAAGPALRGLRSLADDILPELTSQTRPITRAAEAFEAWAEAMSESGQTVSRWRGAMGFLRHIATIASVAGRAIDVLGGAVGAFAETSQPFWRALKDALEALRSPLQNVGESLGRLLAAFAPLLEPLGLLVALVIDIAATLLTVLSPVIEGIASILNAILTPALEWVQGQFGSWQEAMEGVSTWMETVFLPFLQDEIIPFFQETFGAAISYIKEHWDEWYAAMVAVATYISERVWPVIRDELLPTLEELWDEGRKLYRAWMDLQDALASLAKAIAAELMPELGDAEGATALLDFVVGALVASIRGMTFGVKIITSTLRPWVDGLRAVADAVSKAADKVGTARDVMEGLLGKIDRILQQGGRVVGIFNDMRSSAADLAGAIGRIPSLPSGLSSGLGGLLPFADGGIVWGPQAALIGEAGPEVVIPLTRPERAAELVDRSGLAAMLGLAPADSESEPTGRPIEVHMHVQSANADADQVARRAIRQLRREIDGGGLDRLERRRR